VHKKQNPLSTTLLVSSSRIDCNSDEATPWFINEADKDEDRALVRRLVSFLVVVVVIKQQYPL
jgi:hypothetical protein